MSDRTKLFVIARVPDSLIQKFTQHIRDFDAAHPDCQFEIAVEAPNVTVAEAVERLKINPALTFTKIFKR